MRKFEFQLVNLIILGLAVIAGVQAQALPAPELMEPAQDARYGSYSGLPVCRWLTVSGALRYHIELGLDSEFSVSSGPIEVTGTVFRFSDFIEQQQWTQLSLLLYWRIRAVDSVGAVGTWSEVRSFHKTRLMAPTITEPATGTSFGVNDAPPSFKWRYSETYEQAVAFIFEIDDNDDEKDGSLGRLEVWTEEFEFDLSTLIQQWQWDPVSFVFYIRMWGVDVDGHHGPYSNDMYFYKAAIPGVSPVSPGNWESFGVYSRPPVISWESLGSGNGQYILQFVSDEDYQEVLGEVQMTDTAIDFQNYIYDEDWHKFSGSFRWRVRSYDWNGIPGPWGPGRIFLKLGANRVICLGDSITGGYGSSSWEEKWPDIWGEDLAGYPLELDYILEAENYDPQAQALVYWIGGGQAFEGAWGVWDAMAEFCPTHVLILFGIVDLIDPFNCPDNACRTVHYLRELVTTVQDLGAQPIIGTLLPVNPESRDPRAQQWGEQVADLNPEIIAMAAAENVPVADLYQGFIDRAPGGDLSFLFADYDDLGVHPSDLGHQIMAEVFFETLSWYL